MTIQYTAPSAADLDAARLLLARLGVPARVRDGDPHGVARVDRQRGLEVAREVPVQRSLLERQLVESH